ncbi:MAG TPA: hypothetical protein VLA04_03650 [Verrucomicrobiae bacterium]|nr:hypothetical protein [Verrucomicrobiae bacterium]
MAESLGEFLSRELPNKEAQGVIDVDGKPARTLQEDFRLLTTRAVTNRELHDLIAQHYQAGGFVEKQRDSGAMAFSRGDTQVILTLSNNSHVETKSIMVSVNVI